MNPFDLSGPEFLLFYALASLAGCIFLYLVSRGFLSGSARFPSGNARRLLRDPYLLAFLRGGVRETLQTAVYSLNKRQLLSSTGQTLVANRSRDALQAVRHPLELAVLTHCSDAQTPLKLLQNKRLRISVDAYAEPLRESGLVADSAERSRRLPSFLGVTGTLLALGAFRIYVAVQRDHTSLVYLVMLTAIALLVAHIICRRERTNAGDRALTDQQTLFALVKSRVGQVAVHRSTDEDVLVAAAFGLAALPAAAYPFAAQLNRQAQPGHSGCGASSGCGSGGGGGCGGCGGGGCGGG